LFAVDGKEEAFRSYPKNAEVGETCRKLLTTENTGDTEVIAGNHPIINAGVVLSGRAISRSEMAAQSKGSYF
jgi:hypothetical protein